SWPTRSWSRKYQHGAIADRFSTRGVVPPDSEGAPNRLDDGCRALPSSLQHSREDLAMDVPTTSSASVESRGTHHLLIDRGELRSVLSTPTHELCRPLTPWKAGFALLLGEPASKFTADQRSHILTMVTLCDDLLSLTRSYLDFAGIVQGSRPLCLGR